MRWIYLFMAILFLLAVDALLLLNLPEEEILVDTDPVQMVLEPVELNNMVTAEMGEDPINRDALWWKERRRQEDIDQRRALRDIMEKERNELEHERGMREFFEIYQSGGWE